MAVISVKDRYRFKRDLEEVEACRGRGTELISLYVPPNRQIHDVTNQLRGEYSQSSNIKSTSTRKNVTSAIESILQKLKHFKRPPPHGIVFFVGHKAISRDHTRMVSFVIEPPEPIAVYLYRCDSAFFTEPLKEQLRERMTYGLLVIDRKEATFGFLKGKRIEAVKNVQSQVPSKHRMGGQSSKRFERLIEIAAHEFYKKIGDLSTEIFLSEPELKGILVGGPGATKDYFVEGGYLHHELQKKVVETFDTGYTDEYGLREIVEAAHRTLADIDLMREKKLVQRLMEEIRKEEGGLSAYGEAQVRHGLDAGAVEVLLVSEALRKRRVDLECPQCGKKASVTLEGGEDAGVCPDSDVPYDIVREEDIVEELYRRAEGTSTRVEMVSRDSDEGELLLRAFGGLAAILRYRVA